MDMINEIYDQQGFDGVINYIEDKLELGTVTQTPDNLICITTGGWSEDEFLLDELITFLSKFRKHYVGFLVGGAYYFDKKRFNTYSITRDEKRLGQFTLEDKTQLYIDIIKCLKRRLGWNAEEVVSNMQRRYNRLNYDETLTREETQKALYNLITHGIINANNTNLKTHKDINIEEDIINQIKEKGIKIGE